MRPMAGYTNWPMLQYPIASQQATGSESPAHVIVYAGQQSGLSVASWVNSVVCTCKYVFRLSIYGDAEINGDLAELLALGMRVNHTHTPPVASPRIFTGQEESFGLSWLGCQGVFSGVWVRCPAGKSFGNLFIYVIDATRTKWEQRSSQHPTASSRNPSWSTSTWICTWQRVNPSNNPHNKHWK